MNITDNHFLKGHFSQHLRWAQYSRFAIFTLVLQRASKHTPISASIASTKEEPEIQHVDSAECSSFHVPDLLANG